MNRLLTYTVFALLLAVVFAQRAGAALTFTDTTNITLANSQVESGGDTTDDPNVVNGPVGAVVNYPTASSSAGICCGATFDLFPNLNDNDIGVGVPSDGTYALPNSGTLTLGFGGTVSLGSIAIYNGYGNRDDGTYTLRDGANNLLGAWTVAGTPGASNDGVNSFWLKFNSPVTTNELRLTATVENSQSYREIDVFAPVPEPTTAALAIAGLVVLLPTIGRKLRRFTT